MIKLPDEKQDLIEWLKPQIAEMENICDEIPFGLDEDDAMQLKVMRFALDSLNSTAQPVSDGWVKCSERMPKFGTSVLVWDEGVITGESTGSTTSFGLGIFWASDQKEDSGSVKCYATHWMPQPAAPGGQDD